MNSYDQSVDLTSCDIEPIHIIGRIQSFGYLIAFSADWIISHVSENIGDLLGRSFDDVIGTPASTILSASALHDIRSRLQLLTGDDAVERIFNVDVIGNQQEFDIAVHRSGRSFVIEFEESESSRHRDMISFVRPMMERLRNADNLEKLLSLAARQVRGLTGFDRVMIYRFEPDGAGEVIAESVNGSVDSFHGLHFPAADIPKQARKLYSRNLLRIITDVADPTVPIVPQTNPAGEPLDLSMSMLRAVSPIHIEYLMNMGVAASMSISIMRRGKLWGLIACHHYAPLRLSYAVRTAAELFGEFLAFLLDQKESDFKLERRKLATRLHDDIMASVVNSGSLLGAFESFTESISRVIPFDGAIGWVDGEFVAQGSTPTRAEFEKLARFLNTTGAGMVWSTDNLQAAYPPAAEFSDAASGLLALPVSRAPRDYIVLFRKEYQYELNWAGNPEKVIEYGPNGSRLSPRKSFDLWKEERVGFSREWTEEETEIAESLRITLLEVILRLADLSNLQREEASQRQEVLIAELNHRVRNILNLIKGLIGQSRNADQTIEEFTEILGQRIHALARAHDLVTKSSWSPSSFHKLVLTESDAYASDSAERVVIKGPDAMIEPGAFTTLALVVHELTTNSCKYGALSAEKGTVTVATEKLDDGSLRLHWQESGGPPVTPPDNRGFGSTIIERTIPHELNGYADVAYERDGLSATFVLPADYVATYDMSATAAPRSEADVSTLAYDPERFASRNVLIVEDNVIIAMEAEDMFAELGFDKCRIAGSVHSAERMIDDGEIGLAMLDVNLGSATSVPVAKKLRDLGIPFFLASGYGEELSERDQFGSVPIVTKPYTVKDLKNALAEIAD